MKRKVKLADVLWEAANRWLMSTTGDWNSPPLEYSCNAAIASEFGAARPWINLVHRGKQQSQSIEFLRSLGCDPGQSGRWSGISTFSTDRLQGIRHMWLLLAMHVAEDEGIVIEVEA